jgi:hypothetical protein
MRTTRGGRLNENKNQGAWGELYGDDILTIRGYKNEKTVVGSDVHSIKQVMWENIIDDKLFDYKTGNANLSDKQKECGAQKLHIWIPPFARHFSPPRRR